jgi:hypothetical protein
MTTDLARRAAAIAVALYMAACLPTAPLTTGPSDPAAAPAGTDFLYRRGLWQMGYPVGHHGYWTPMPDAPDTTRPRRR